MLAQVDASPLAVMERFTRKAPVDLQGMADALGIPVLRDRALPDDVSGKIERAGDGFRITVNAQHPARRQRFTLAHELAHYLLHRDMIGVAGVVDGPLYRSSELTDEVEAQANRFAADLLMPAALVRGAHRNGKVAIVDMASMFDVSPEVAGIRMRGLRLGA